MKNTTLTILLSIITSTLFASNLSSVRGTIAASSASENNMKTLFQCGVGTEKGFDGWMLSGLSHETITWFEKDHIEFFQHHPGNYSIGFEKKIDDMIGYTDLRLSTEINAVENCQVNCATAYVSKNGKEWIALNKDPRYGAGFYSEKMEFMFVKIVADITFYHEGRFRMNRATIYGDYHIRKSKPDFELSELAKIANGPASNQIYEAFFIFSFDKKINVETQSDNGYEFVLSNLLGQVVLREKSKGSRRFEVDVPDGIYFVTILQDDKLITTKKVVL